ncbi:MAG: squalene synthase HpnC [Bacteroidota bacterium]
MKFSPSELFDMATPDGGALGVESVEEAYGFCEKIATSHYENFPVGSLLIPKKQRPHFYSVYAYSRLADDIADELSDDPEIRLKALNDLENLLKSEAFKNGICNKKCNPVFLALRTTIDELHIPQKPFLKLLKAFRQDILFEQPETFKDLTSYCENSANPVGELVLRIFRLYNETTAEYSDAVCTGLQLANFWQDFSIDLPKARLYIPLEFLKKYGLQKDNLQEPENSAKFRKCLDELLKITDEYFLKGTELLPFLKDKRLRLEIAITIEGGRMITQKVRELGADVLFKRPVLTKKDYFSIAFRALRNIFSF